MKEIPGFPEYFASEEGHIYSMKLGYLIKMSPRIKDGYYHLCVRQTPGQRKQMPVHKLILLTFQGEKPSPEAQSRHLNGCRLDNHATNLKWGTPSENTADAIRHGTAVCLRVGEEHPRTKLDRDQVMDIKQRLAKGEKQIDIASLFSISQRHVSAIKRGEIYLARGMAV